MKTNFGFSNLLGTVYAGGTLVFTPDGNSLLSPVGNRLSCFNLVQNTSFTFDYEHRKNIITLALSPKATLLITVDEDGRAILVNFVRRRVLHHFNFKKRVTDILFAPNGDCFAVSAGIHVEVWKTPTSTRDRDFSPFVRHRVYAGHFNDVQSISWSKDSRFFLSSSRDLTVRIFSVDPTEGFQPTILSGHRESVIASFFSDDQEAIYTVSRDGALFRWNYESTWKIASRHYFLRKVRCAAFHSKSNLLIVGFTDGVFALYELPEFNMIHNLSISHSAIDYVAVNGTAEWLAFGASQLGQLLVWEWQSETYVLKQQGHYDAINSVIYSPDSSKVVSAADDGKIKVWDPLSGFCTVTFTEHTSGVSQLEFARRSNVLFSASLDGSVRAWDLVRYRNFRTFAAPTRLRFSALAVDPSGEIVCAGSLDSFDIHVWSVQTGQLLDRLAGHEGPISSLSFAQDGGLLTSGSWDKSVRVWDIFSRKMSAEPLQLQSDVLSISFRPDAQQLAVATLDGQITIWEVRDGRQIASIDGRKDISGGRKDSDRRSAANSVSTKHFNNICYSTDGTAILAGGNSKYVCLYDCETAALIEKLTLSNNLSLEGTQEILSSRNMTEAGPIAEIEANGDHSEDELRPESSMPGAARGDLSSRRTRPEIRSKAVSFSSTARSFAVASTEGLMVFALDNDTAFDPFDLEMDITPESTLLALKQKEYLQALVMAFRLNEQYLIKRVFNSIPAENIKLVVPNLPSIYLPKILEAIANPSAFLEVRLMWMQAVLTTHGKHIKASFKDYASNIRDIQKTLNEMRNDIVRISDENVYACEYILDQGKNREVLSEG